MERGDWEGRGVSGRGKEKEREGKEGKGCVGE